MEQTKISTLLHKVLDISLTASAFISAYFIKLHLLPLKFRGLIPDPNYYIVLLLIIIIFYPIFSFHNVYKSYRSKTLLGIHWNTLKAVSIGMMFLVMAMYVFKITDISRIMLGIFYILDLTFLMFSKTIAYFLLKCAWKRGYNFRNLLIIGGRERARDVIKAVADNMTSGYRIIGCIGLENDEVGKIVVDGIKYIDTLEHLKNILVHQVIDEIIFALPLNLIKDVEKHIATAEEIGVSVRIMPDWQIHQLMYKPTNAHVQIGDFLNLPTIHLTTTPSENDELHLKNAFDYLGAVFLSILLFAIFSDYCRISQAFIEGTGIFQAGTLWSERSQNYCLQISNYGA